MESSLPQSLRQDAKPLQRLTDLPGNMPFRGANSTRQTFSSAERAEIRESPCFFTRNVSNFVCGGRLEERKEKRLQKGKRNVKLKKEMRVHIS